MTATRHRMGVRARCMARSSRNRIYRSRSKRMFAGVIGGISERLGIAPVWLRLAAIILQCTALPFLFLIYIGACFFMPREPRLHETESIHIPEPQVLLPPIPVVTPNVNVADMHAIFDEIESRIRDLEDYVTSREFALNQKFLGLKAADPLK